MEDDIIGAAYAFQVEQNGSGFVAAYHALYNLALVFAFLTS